MPLVTRHSSLVTALLALAATSASAGGAGFFRVERDAAGAWRLVDPAGNPTVWLGVDHVKFDGFRCEADGNRKHYREANERQFGSREAWATNTAERLRSWGFPMFRYLREAGVPFSRLHDVGGMFGRNVFVDIPNVFRDFDADETDPANYDFSFTDVLLNALVENGVEPFYRLGVTIENYATIRRYRIELPKDFAKWARICEHVIRHYTEGWADGFRHTITHWEIWNEPENWDDPEQNQMWHGSFEEYCRLYEAASKHLKACFPHLKIGGYGSCGLGEYSPLFNPLTYKPHKAYYAFLAFHELRKRGSAVEVGILTTETQRHREAETKPLPFSAPLRLCGEKNFAAAARGPDGSLAVMFANPGEEEVPLALEIADSSKRTTASRCRIVDETRARFISLMIGTNNVEDSPEDRAEGIRAILAKIARLQPDATVLLHPIFPCGAAPDDPRRVSCERTNSIVRRFADGGRVVWLDFNARFLQPDGTLPAAMMPDFLHPLEEGYRIWADALRPFLHP